MSSWAAPFRMGCTVLTVRSRGAIAMYGSILPLAVRWNVWSFAKNEKMLNLGCSLKISLAVQRKFDINSYCTGFVGICMFDVQPL